MSHHHFCAIFSLKTWQMLETTNKCNPIAHRTNSRLEVFFSDKNYYLCYALSANRPSLLRIKGKAKEIKSWKWNKMGFSFQLFPHFFMFRLTIQSNLYTAQEYAHHLQCALYPSSSMEFFVFGRSFRHVWKRMKFLGTFLAISVPTILWKWSKHGLRWCIHVGGL